MFDVNVSLEQLIEPSSVLCVAAKWLGEKQTYFFSDWTDGHASMLEQVHGLLSMADAVVTYNGDRFDLPKLRGEFALLGYPPIPPLTSIDLYKTVKKLGLQSGKLAFVGPFFGIGKKIKHEGFSLWTSVMDGDKKAQKRMEKYCVGDVTLTELVYMRLRPYITNHPHLGDTGRGACGSCGGTVLQSRGFRRTKAFKIQRLHCQSCGSWQDGSRTKAG